MNERNDITRVLDLMVLPGFCVENRSVTALNAAARGLLLTEGTDISGLLLTGAEEYAAFTGGCLYLTLSLGGQRWGASVTRMEGCDVFVLEQEEDQAELKSMALAARELREPLTNVMITAERLFPMADQGRDENTRAQMARLNRGLYQMLRILSNMSDAGETRVSRQETCDITAAAAEIFEKAADLILHAGLHLTYQGPSEPIYTLADRDQLERAILNMLSNAMKYAPRESTVQANLVRSGNRLHLSISDAGSGIPDSILSNLFRRYLRQPGIEDRRYGIGLGMVLIRSAAAAHGGTVLIDRNPEGGTRVTMTLSIHQNPDPTLRSPVFRVDYAGERDHGLLEFSESLPAHLYEKE